MSRSHTVCGCTAVTRGCEGSCIFVLIGHKTEYWTDMIAVLEERRRSKFSRVQPLGIIEMCTNFMATHLIVAERFQFGLKWWTDRLTTILFKYKTFQITNRTQAVC